MQPDESFIARIGTFFVVMGIGSLILFVASDFAQKTDFDFLFVAMLLIGLGWLCRRRKPPPPSAGRFSGIRKIQEDAKKRREEKSKQKDKKK